MCFSEAMLIFCGVASSVFVELRLDAGAIGGYGDDELNIRVYGGENEEMQ